MEHAPASSANTRKGAAAGAANQPEGVAAAAAHEVAVDVAPGTTAGLPPTGPALCTPLRGEETTEANVTGDAGGARGVVWRSFRGRRGIHGRVRRRPPLAAQSPQLTVGHGPPTPFICFNRQDEGLFATARGTRTSFASSGDSSASTAEVGDAVVEVGQALGDVGG